MAAYKLDKSWAIIIFLLVAIIVGGGVLALTRYNRSEYTVVSLPSYKEIEGQIYVNGAVVSPGYYTQEAGDSIDSLILAAGGATGDADLTRLSLTVSRKEDQPQPQKVDINRADTWLLEALPGVGKIRAQAIVNYRNQNGLFHHISELTMVEDVSVATYEKLKDFITVAD